MKITESAREILNADLTDEQVERAIEAAADDAQHWTAEAANNTLPEIDGMSLDWQIDEDLREAGVDGYAMQRLSFAIAKS
jgi:plasmid stability protein